VLSGRCACKAVEYEVSDEFVAAYNCHCSNCRAMTGAAFLPVGRIKRDKLRVTRGAESLLVEGDPDSTYEVRCSECFSLLYWTSRDGCFGVPYGTLNGEPTLKPTYHQFVGSKAPWYEILDDLPQHDARPL
jgi:hypothetical protein